MVGYRCRKLRRRSFVQQAIERIEREEVDTLEDISHYIGNIEAKVDVEKLKSEQAIQPLSITELDALIEEANFTESIDELLESIKS